ncbi:uncharacterized protein LOC108852434 isoform X1 [Raphanus sativus]|uniref:Uncharacterized protein LOC108852434 isoform X1 n=1 Tax=Raphanus sativus TaxID=3726 RepID=A0A9W3DGZ6_RAPSA|nr:uncharacterized protein LOC108852434 isoform X1 [Raphanus sativus]
MDEILRKKEEELKTELKKLQKIKEFNPNMSFLRRHARVRGHVLKWGINNVLRKVVPMVRKTWRSYSFFPFSADNLFTIGCWERRAAFREQECYGSRKDDKRRVEEVFR